MSNREPVAPELDQGKNGTRDSSNDFYAKLAERTALRRCEMVERHAQQLHRRGKLMMWKLPLYSGAAVLLACLLSIVGDALTGSVDSSMFAVSLLVPGFMLLIALVTWPVAYWRFLRRAKLLRLDVVENVHTGIAHGSRRLTTLRGRSAAPRTRWGTLNRQVTLLQRGAFYDVYWVGGDSFAYLEPSMSEDFLDPPGWPPDPGV